MEIFSYSTKSTVDILKEFKVDAEKGLSAVKVKKNLASYGKNILANGKVRWTDILLRQFKSSFIYLLLFASFLAFIFKERTDAILIMAFLIINASLGFYQEFRSERTIQLLKKYVASFVKAIRSGKEMAVHSEEITPGDIIILETGDKIPADVRFIEINNLIIDESVLTGESAPVKKICNELKEKPKEIYGAANIGFGGTTIVNGKAKAIVILTGKNSTIGKIAGLEKETKKISEFEKSIAKLSNFVIWLVIGTLLFIIAANFLIKGAANFNFLKIAIFSIALAVSVIPEALPIVTTFSLSRGAVKLIKQKVIVKRLSAIEDLGSMEILCTDKTGTLTENNLTVENIYSQSEKETLLYANLACSSVQKNKLEPFDIALWKKFPKDENKIFSRYERITDIPFNPERRRNTVIIKNGNNYEIVLRGAPEVIIDLCSHLTLSEKKSIARWTEAQSINGRRVLAVAKKEIARPKKDFCYFEKYENNLKFLGVISFIDPIKPCAFEAVAQAKDLGVKIVIITGDNKEVAGAVGREIGLIDDIKKVITARELENLPLSSRLDAIENYNVFARVAPEQKYKIVEMLQKKYEVGFLGEGINDVPALRAAGISLVVQGASDIAREAADIILLKKNLKVILDGIKEGREVFTNTTNYIKATLASNFGNFYAVAIASLLVNYLPMLPIQILFLNLLSDFPMIAIAADKVDKTEVSKPKKYDIKDIILIATVLGIVSTLFDFIFFALFYKISPEVLQTNWFIGSILTELILIFSIRSKKLFTRAPKPSQILLWLTLMAGAAAIIIPFTSFGQQALHLIRPSFYYLIIILTLTLLYLICTEISKLAYYKFFNNKH
ncbi:MAG: HAD-IC family P-type ATPase [bacterium]